MTEEVATIERRTQNAERRTQNAALLFLKKCIKWLVIKLLSIFLPTGKIIIFESHPDFTDNTYPVYLLLRKLLPDYKMVWLLFGNDAKDADDAVPISPKTIAEKIKDLYYMLRCRAIIQCNSYRRKLKAKQLSIYLAHGVALKDITGMYNMPWSRVDFHNVYSPFFDKLILQMTFGTQEHLVHLGFPRCDYFFSSSRRQDIDQIVKGKYIIWLPTFRGHKAKTRDDAPGSPFNNIGVPVFYTVDSLKSFDEFLAANDISILYKPHPAQDIDVLKKTELQNFRIINDADILGRNLQLYEVIAQSEALITDYSSVYWEYMLLDRPIGITNDDIEEYKAGRNFILDIEEIYRQTSEVISSEDMMREFVLNVVNGRDIMREWRRQWRDKIAAHSDGKSAERVASFILDKIGRS